MPGAQAIRVPPRAWLPASMCLAVCAGFGVARVWRPGRGRALLIGVVSLGIVGEGWFAEGVVRPPAALLETRIPEGKLALDLPVNEDYRNAAPQYLAVLGGYRSINGYSGYAPPHFGEMRHALADHRPVAWDTFRQYGDLYVIVRDTVDAPFVGWLESQPGVRIVATVPKMRLYLLPSTSTSPPSDEPLPLPTPGRAALTIPQ
jgi:hypothetical protein